MTENKPVVIAKCPQCNTSVKVKKDAFDKPNTCPSCGTRVLFIGIYRGPDGFVISKSRIHIGLASQDESKYNSVLDEIDASSKAGNRKGLDEIERFIRINCPSGHMPEFYTPGGFKSFMGVEEIENHVKKISDYAKELFINAKEVQQMISTILGFRKSVLLELLKNVELNIGWKESRCLEILYAHLINLAYYRKSKGMT